MCFIRYSDTSRSLSVAWQLSQTCSRSPWTRSRVITDEKEGHRDDPLKYRAHPSFAPKSLGLSGYVQMFSSPTSYNQSCSKVSGDLYTTLSIHVVSVLWNVSLADLHVCHLTRAWGAGSLHNLVKEKKCSKKFSGDISSVSYLERSHLAYR